MWMSWERVYWFFVCIRLEEPTRMLLVTDMSWLFHLWLLQNVKETPLQTHHCMLKQKRAAISLLLRDVFQAVKEYQQLLQIGHFTEIHVDSVLKVVIAFVSLFLSLFRFQSLTISIWTWMGLSISVPTRTTRMSTFAFPRKRFLLTSSITWRCSSGSSSLARSSSWQWMAWHQGQRWTSSEDGDSGRHGFRINEMGRNSYFCLGIGRHPPNWVSSDHLTLLHDLKLMLVCLSGFIMKGWTQLTVITIRLPRWSYYCSHSTLWKDFYPMVKYINL